MTITDEILASYVDGETTDEEARRVESALAAEPALLRAMLAMLRADKAAGAYFHAIDDRPLPAGVITALEQFPTGEAQDAPAQRQDNVLPMAAARANGPTTRGAPWHLPLAASIALAIGLGTGMNLGVGPTDPAAGALIAAGQPLYDVLENGASGRTVSLDGATKRYITPLMTVAADGSFCREFEIAATAAIIRGAACRQGDSTWLVVVQTAEPTASPDGTYQAASEARPAAIETFFAAAAPLDAAREQALIANHWIQE